MFLTTCTHCGHSFDAPPHYHGKDIVCLSCRTPFTALTAEERFFSFPCPICKADIEAAWSWEGLQAPCPHCNVTVDIPNPPLKRRPPPPVKSPDQEPAASPEKPPVSVPSEQAEHPFLAAWKKSIAEQNTPENKEKTKQIQAIALVCSVGIALFIVIAALSSSNSSNDPEYDATKAGMEAGFYVGTLDAKLGRAKMSSTTRLEMGRVEAKSYKTSASLEYYARGWADGYSKGYDRY
jgi:hypothetical protein